jgi:hypothetical protein
MASCATCGTTILFGGTRVEELRFCGKKCAEAGAWLVLAKSVPDDVVKSTATEINRGLCPVCHGSGPVDVHTSYRVWSAAVVTSWSSRQRISCRPCGTKRKVNDTLFSLLLGWWGIPHGLLMTPVQVVRNVAGLFSGGEVVMRPSAQLENVVRLELAKAAAANAPADPA